MSDEKVMRPGVPEDDMSTPYQDRCQTVEVDDSEHARRRRKRAADLRASSWFDAGVRGAAKAGSIAAALDIDPGYLSNMRKGNAAIPLRSIVAFEGDTPAVLGFTGGLLHSVKMIAVPIVSEVALAPGQAAVLRHARASLGDLWCAWRDRVAAQLFQCPGTLLEAAINLDEKIGK